MSTLQMQSLFLPNVTKRDFSKKKKNLNSSIYISYFAEELSSVA